MKITVRIHFIRSVTVILIFIQLMISGFDTKGQGLKDAFKDDFKIGVALSPFQVLRPDTLTWDVVNEAIDDDGQMRKTRWYEIIGEDYVQKAFEFAHEADPDALIFYNDYNIEVPQKRAGVIKLLKKLQEQGVKVDGVGLQGHWLLDFPTLEEIDSSIQIYSDMGFRIVITELDVDVLPNPWDKAYADIAMIFPFLAGRIIPCCLTETCNQSQHIMQSLS